MQKGSSSDESHPMREPLGMLPQIATEDFWKIIGTCFYKYFIHRNQQNLLPLHAITLRIDVKSKLNEGTIFRVCFLNWEAGTRL